MYLNLCLFRIPTLEFYGRRVNNWHVRSKKILVCQLLELTAWCMKSKLHVFVV